MLIISTDCWVIFPIAVVDRTMVVPFVEGIEFSVAARSRTTTWIVWPWTHAPGVAELRHLTRYSLPQDAPLSQIPSPAAA